MEGALHKIAAELPGATAEENESLVRHYLDALARFDVKDATLLRRIPIALKVNAVRKGRFSQGTKDLARKLVKDWRDLLERAVPADQRHPIETKQQMIVKKRKGDDDDDDKKEKEHAAEPAAKSAEDALEQLPDIEDYEPEMLPPVPELVVRTPRQQPFVAKTEPNHDAGRVSTLATLCLRKLYAVSSQIGFLGNVPYDVIEAVLATMAWPDLYRVDFMNPALRHDLNATWHAVCKREYPKENDDKLPTDGTLWRRVFQDRKTALLERLRVKIGLIDSERYSEHMTMGL